MSSFSVLSQPLQQVVSELGYAQMTEIQEKSIPLLLEGLDVIGQSKTGSGKTAAFTLPILNRIPLDDTGRIDYRDVRGIQALVLCPTRELCDQVAREIRKLGRKHIGLQVITLSGGVPIGPQINAIERGIQIAVGTPGRIVDHLNRNTVNFSDIRTVVLDEADRMLDMGFQAEMEQVLAALPEVRQTVFFSATFPPSIERMSKRYQKAAVRITVETDESELPNIDQGFYFLGEEEDPFFQKTEALLSVLRELKPDTTLVFANLKEHVSEIARELKSRGVSADCLHGDLEQSERDRVMAKFRNESIRVLVASDVAARGIDVPDLDLVINFDTPPKPEIYVHRIGRTGRAGKTGRAILFTHHDPDSKILAIEKYTGTSMTRLEFKSSDANYDFGEVKSSRLLMPAKMATLFISAGRKNKMRPGDILGALTGEAGGLTASDVGKIEIHDFFSYVAVALKVAPAALERLQNGRIKGLRLRVEPIK